MANVHDIAIVGAGPCGLAMAARLREPFPSALFTDIEHARFWNRPHDTNTIDSHHRSRHHHLNKFSSATISDHSSSVNHDVIVFDACSTEWLSVWRSQFAALEIEHLRSPLFFHPDPGDRDGLLAFAHEQNRGHEMLEIHGVVGKEESKHSVKKRHARGKGKVNMTSCHFNEKGFSAARPKHLHLDARDKNDYFTPSTALFNDYVDQMIHDRYQLDDIVQKARIVHLSYHSDDGACAEDEKIFSLKTSTGEKYHARIVILATGPSVPRIPPSIEILAGRNVGGSASHVFDPTCPIIPTRLLSQLEHSDHTKPSTNIVVVGGGLTSAQLAMLLVSRFRQTRPGVRIHLILRSRLKVKHFDIDLPWVAKLRNRYMAEFWSADTDAERFSMLTQAKGGGSVTPTYAKMLRAEESKGRLVIHEGWEIDGRDDNNNGTSDGSNRERTCWNSDHKTWKVVLKSSNHDSLMQVNKSSIRAEHVERNVIQDVPYIFFATSSPPDVTALPFLDELRQTYSVSHVNGLPVLTQDLKWHANVPMFVTGALAGLRLGPGAGNLAGARLGAERIAWAIEEMSDNDWRGRSERSRSVWPAGQSRSTDKDVERDSGYVSEDTTSDDNETSFRGEATAREQGDQLVNEFVSGIGSRFEVLNLLSEEQGCY